MSPDTDIPGMRRKRGNLKSKFTRRCNSYKERHLKGDPSDVLKGLYAKVETSFTELENICESVIDLLVINDSEQGDIDEAHNYLSQCESDKCDIQALQSVYLQGAKHKQPDATMMKLESMKFPIFDGNPRTYPTFKDDLTTIVMPKYGENPCALRQCLGEIPKMAIRGCEKSYDQMIAKLDEEFGDPRKLVDLVIGDLKKLILVNDNDNMSFINMVTIIEQCYLDLKKVDLEQEMNSVTIVSMIEKILPRSVKRDWIKLSDDIIDKSSLFPFLLKFLLKEKRVTVYSYADVRNDKIFKCNVNNLTCNNNSDAEFVNTLKDLKEDQVNTKKLLNDIYVKLNINDKANIFLNNISAKRCWLHEFDGHHISTCGRFRSMSSSERLESAKRKGICYRCLGEGHLGRFCNSSETCTVKVNGQICNKHHHHLLHDSFSLSSNNYNVNCQNTGALLEVSIIYSFNQPITVIWDSASDTTLITHRMAKLLGLRSKNVIVTITKVGNVVDQCNTKQYNINVHDKWGVEHTISALGMDEIASEIPYVNLYNIDQKFPGFSPRILNRPKGKVDMLIGLDYCNLLPQVYQTCGNLQLLENQFGFCLRGMMSDNKYDRRNIQHILTRVHHVSIHNNTDIIDVEIDNVKEQLDSFFKIENAGTECEPKCAKCLCLKCPTSDGISLKEKRELELIERGLRYEETEQTWVASYPWILDPYKLPNNYNVARARLVSTENRLYKLGDDYMKLYDVSWNDMIDRKIAYRLNKNEIFNYDGPIHYIAHSEVLKESSSTPLRIVFDSSTSFKGHRLNDYWAKGPSIINDLFGVLLRFREEQVGIVGDISKMYHTVKTDVFDQHVHRVLWRGLDRSREPDQYVLTSLTFGDRPSGPLATLALRYTADMYKESHPLVASMINNNTYVDDVLYSVPSVQEAQKIILDTEEVLSRGGFKVKHWTISGDVSDISNITLAETPIEKVLGMYWTPGSDEFSYKVKINFSKKVKGIREELELNRWQCINEFPDNITRRKFLSAVASVYDPFGLVLPSTLPAKILMRTLVTKNLNRDNKIHWDDILDEQTINNLKDFFVSLYDLEDLSFVRCIKPKDATGNPDLIIFSDGSEWAFGCVGYLRWTLINGGIDVRLISAKNRIAPARQITIPRLELNGAVLACRLREKNIHELTFHCNSVVHIIDSSIVLSQIHSESHMFNTFVATRISEIQMKSNLSEWYWIESKLNVADYVTKPCKPHKLKLDSMWQRGPEFLYLPQSEWPVKKNVDFETLSDLKISSFICEANMEFNVFNIVDIERFSNFFKFIRAVCRVLSIYKLKSFNGVFVEPTGESLKITENFVIKEVQKSLGDWNDKYKCLGPSEQDGFIVVGQRISKWLKDNWNQDYFILLPATHPFTSLYISYLHYLDHAGIEITLAKLQSRFWVPGAIKLIRSIKKKCVYCRKIDESISGQSMGQVPNERMKPSPPFFHTATDLFGPLPIKDSVRRRVHGKCYGVIFVCLSSRAIYLDIVENYSTDAFLGALKRFVSIRGFPSTLHSDNGTQLTCANKQLRDITNNFNMKEVCKFGSNEGMSWSFNKAGDAPWLNASCESLLRLVKNGLLKSMGDSVLTFAELQTVMYEVSNLINSRPIGRKPGSSIDDGSYLCPNDFLLGRNNNSAPGGTFDLKSNYSKRLKFVQSIVNNFWKRWMRDYWHTMVVRKKWHVVKRNVCPKDIVLVKDSNAVKGIWKIAEVISVDVGRDGLVRTVTLRYKICQPGISYKGSKDKMMERSVHRLVILIPVEEREE